MVLVDDRKFVVEWDFVVGFINLSGYVFSLDSVGFFRVSRVVFFFDVVKCFVNVIVFCVGGGVCFDMFIGVSVDWGVFIISELL